MVSKYTFFSKPIPDVSEALTVSHAATVNILRDVCDDTGQFKLIYLTYCILLSACARNIMTKVRDIIDLFLEIEKDKTRQMILIFRSQIFIRANDRNNNGLFLSVILF